MHARSFLVAAALAAAFACSKPQPPTLVPKKAEVTAISPSAITMSLTIDATNPNSIPLAIQSVSAQIVLDKKYEMGTATVTKAFDLPASKTTTIAVPVSVPWSNVGPLVALGASGRDVAYDVEGNATIGGENLNVTVPFTATGTLKHDDLLKATMSSIPAIPGLTLPGAH